MSGTDKCRWKAPPAGTFTLRFVIDSRASDEVKRETFDKEYRGIEAMFGKEVADTLKWDKGHGPEN